MRKIAEGFLAGILISIGGSVFLACMGSGTELGKYVGAVLFSVALLCICIKGYSLYTGKIGFIVLSHTKEDFSVLLLGLLGNALATIALGFVLKYAIPSFETTATTICQAKLDGQNLLQTFIRGCFCGVLMYLAVSIYKEHKTVVGIVFCIPVFILAGFEHSIADMFYFACSSIVSFDAFLFLMMVVLGNSVGAMLMPLLRLIPFAKNKE